MTSCAFFVHTRFSELRRMLYALFSTHGAIIEVVALKTNKMRGQAFVIYKGEKVVFAFLGPVVHSHACCVSLLDIQSATAAKQELNNFPFYGRPMRVDFSKSRSHLVEKMEGTFDEEQAAARRLARG
jgi:U2 small nuclear ribonucleoprotein B''